jgi:CheY-like chemotaxis protein
VVDDNPDLRMLMRIHLHRRGVAVAEAGDGIQALEVVSNLRPDLVLLDLHMPRLDGFGFLERRRGTTPVVLLTALDDDWVREQALRLGAVGFLVKSRDFAGLVAGLGKWLDHPCRQFGSPSHARPPSASSDMPSVQ